MSTPATPPDYGTAPRPEPVVSAAKLAAAAAGLVAAIGAITTLWGWTTADQVQSVVVLIGGLITAAATLVATVAPILAAYKARKEVTPLADPRDSHGHALVSREDGSSPRVTGR
jgi:hypothetical protein